MRSRSAITLLVTGVLLGAAVPAAADKPARGCPDHFQAKTYPQVLEDRPNVTQELFDTYDKNGDGVLCVKRTANRPLSDTGKPGIYNPIDNTARR